MFACGSLVLIWSAAGESASDWEQLRQAKVVAVSVDASNVPSSSPLPFQEILEKMLLGAGVEVVRSTQSPECSMAIQVQGLAHGAQYSNVVGGRYAYTGATIQGTMTVSCADRAVQTIPFKGSIPVSESVRGAQDYSKPSYAPFERAFLAEGSFLDVALQLFTGIYGPRSAAALLGHPNVNIGYKAANFLIQANHPDSVAALLPLLNVDARYARRNAAEVLGSLGGATTSEPLRSALADSDESVASTAFQSLKRLSRDSLAEHLITLSRDKNPLMRSRAVRWLASVDRARAIEPLIAALRDVDISVRAQAATGLGELKARDSRVIDSLVALLKDSREERMPNGWLTSPRAMAAHSLGLIGDPRAIGPLVESLSYRPSWRFSEEVPQALKKLTKQDFGKDAPRWNQWWAKEKGH